MKSVKTITIQVSPEAHKRYKMYSVENEVSFKEIFTEEMERRIKEAEEKKKEK